MAKLPPHSIEAEEAVLGSILLDGMSIGKIADSLRSEDFYSERNSSIYEAGMSLYQRELPVDQITLAQEMNSRGKLENSGGAAYLAYLVANCPTSLDIEHYAAIVHRYAQSRRIIEAGAKIAEYGYDIKMNPDEAIDKSRSLLDDIKPVRSRHLELSNLRIIKSRPPHYILNVNGEDMNLTLGELQQWGKFRTKVMAERDFIPFKPFDWDMLVNNLLARSAKMEAPIDASPENEVRLSIKRWFDQRGEGSEYSDIQAGSYAVVPYRGPETEYNPAEYWAFQPTPLLRWLKRDLGKVVTRDNLWAMMVNWGGIKWQWRIGKGQGTPVRLWALPPSFAEATEFAMEKEVRQEEMAIEGEGEEEGEEIPDI
jgi:hypothetical protein